ncbi:MAG: magnesium transporter [Candidatus Bathyarchaeia archaeon]
MDPANASTDFALMSRVYREATPFVLLTALIELGAGSMLLGLEETFLLLPGLLFMMPGLMQLRGNIASSLAARLGSAIHIGLVSWEKGYNRILKENVYASIHLSLIMSAVLGAAAYAWTVALGLPVSSLWVLVLIAVLAATLSGVVQAHIAVFVAVYTAYRGLDPDNVTIPLLTALGDILTVLFVILIVNIPLFLVQLAPS